jgi:hypothetical protein
MGTVSTVPDKRFKTKKADRMKIMPTLPETQAD